MLTYVYFGTQDLERAIRFYDATLGSLGMQRCITGDAEWDRVSAGWGIYEEGDLREFAFWIGIPFNKEPATAGNGSMSRFVRAHGTPSMISMPPRSPTAEAATVLRACDCITAPTFTPRTCATRMATSLPLFAAATRSDADDHCSLQKNPFKPTKYSLRFCCGFCGMPS